MQSYVCFWVHAVWSVKNREPLLRSELRWPLFQQMKAIGQEKGIYLDFVNGVSDHVHALIGLKSTQTVANVMKELKAGSSHWLNQQGVVAGEFHWQDGYGAFSVSPSHVAAVRNYIRNQEHHHRETSFETEWERLKTKNTHTDKPR